MSTAYVSGTPIESAVIHPSLQPLVARAGAVPTRLRVAKALLPAPPDALIPALLFLTQDPEAQVKAAARDSLTTMPADVLVPVLIELADPSLLDAAARVLHKVDEAGRRVALNPNTSDDTMRWLAGVANGSVCDAIGQNQVRALRYPAIIEAIYLNPRASQGVTQGLLELAVRSQLALDHMPGFKETKALLLGEEVDDGGTGLSDMEFASALLMASGQGEEQAADAPPDEKKTASLQALILKMSVAQKVRLAMVGDAGVRKLLIRDPKKMVAFAVLKSPRVTEGEVTAFAANKALADDLIAMICRNRSWTKDYATRKNLVFNPKTPITFSMSFLRTLTQKDVKDCAMSRDVNQNIARAAKRMLAPK